jgi:competence protein ComEA
VDDVRDRPIVPADPLAIARQQSVKRSGPVPFILRERAMPPGTSTTSAQQPAERVSDAELKPTSPPPTQTAAQPSADVQTVLGLNRGDRRVLAVLIVVAMLLMLVHWYRLTQYRPQPIEVLHPDGYLFQLDVNTATWVEWMQLDGVGETLSRRIVEDRRLNGPFASVDDVQRVPGIGPKTLEAMRPHLRCASQPGGRTDGDNPVGF